MAAPGVRFSRATGVLGNRRRGRALSLGRVGGSRVSVEQWLAPWGGAQWVSTTVTNVTSFSDPHTYNLPTVAVGDRLVVVASFLDSLAATTPVTDMSAWTSFLANEINPFHTWRGYTIYIADAGMVTTWSGATVVFNCDNGGKSTCVAVRVANGHSGGLDTGFDVSALSTAVDSTQPNPPELVPAWGEDENLWLTFATAGSGGDTFTQAPQDYNDLTQGLPTGAIVTAVAVRYTIAGGEDPGAFTLSGTENNQALTFAVRPAAGAQASSGTVTAPIGLTSRAAGVKGGAAGGRVAIATTARPDGRKAAPGFLRAPAAVFTRSVGSKATTGALRGSSALVSRAVGAKAAPGSVRSAMAVHGRAVLAKGALGSARAALAIVGRLAGVKGGAAGGRVAVTTTSRVVGTKGAIGSSRTAQSVTASVVGSAVVDAVSGSVRAVLSVVARVSGSKGGVGSTRAAATVIGRPAGAKGAAGSARSVGSTVARAAGRKSAPGEARAVLPVVGRIAGRLGAAGAVRAPAGITARAVGGAVRSGAVRAASSVWALLAGTRLVPPSITGTVEDSSHLATVRDSSHSLTIRDGQSFTIVDSYTLGLHDRGHTGTDTEIGA